MKQQVAARLDKELVRRIRAVAKTELRTVSAIIARCVSSGIDMVEMEAGLRKHKK